MKKLSLFLLILLIPVQSFATYDPMYYASLSGEDQHTIDLIGRINPWVVSIIGKKQVERRTISCFMIVNGFCLRSGKEQPDKVERGEQVFVQGSGFFVYARGLIVTNRHVVERSDLTYEVLMIDGKRYPAKVLKQSATDDIALLQITGNNFPSLRLGNSDSLMIGQTALAIGNTLWEYQNTVTKGIVSGLDRTLSAGTGNGTETLSGVIQTSASISPGNSGGPLVDSAGNVIGMNTAVDLGGQNLGFALPSNRIRDFLKEYVATTKRGGK